MGVFEAADGQAGRQLADAFDHAVAGMAIGSPDGRLLRVNGALCDLLGRRPEELVGHDIREFTHPDDVEISEHARATQGSEPYEKRYLRPDGSVVFGLARGAAILGADGAVSHHVGSVVDITARKRSEAELARRSSQQQAVLVLGQGALDGLAGDDLIDAALATVVAELEVPGAVLVELGDDESRAPRTVGDIGHPAAGRAVVLVDGEPWGLVTAHASGAVGLGEDDATFLRRVAYVLGSAIARERHARGEERAREQDRLAVAGQLAAGLAHDFNNVLTVVKLHAELLRRQPELTEAGQRQAAVISEQTDRAITLVWQLLDVARRGELHCEPVDLAVFTAQLAPVLRRTLPEQITFEAPQTDAPAVVVADISRLHQIVLNLTANARDALPDGGAITIRVRPEEVGGVPGQLLEFHDTGDGMSAEVLARACEPFFSTKGPGYGTGLGLAQVRAIVDQHEGRLGIDSSPDAGTCVSIWLPSTPPSGSVARRVAAPAASRRYEGRGEKILVVEDDAAVAGAVADQLRDLGYVVAVAANGQEALALLDELGDVDLVFSDVAMPVMGGVDLARELRARVPDLPVVLTGAQRPDLEDRALGWLQKPYPRDRLAMVVAASIAPR